MKYLAKTIVAILVYQMSAIVSAHGGHDDRFKVNVTDTSVDVELHLQPDFLTQFDDNGNGSLSVDEYRNHKTELSDWVDRHLVLIGQDERVIQASFADMPIVGFDTLEDEAAINSIRVIRRYPIEANESMQLRVGLFKARSAPRPFVLWRPEGNQSGWLPSEGAVLLIPGVSTKAVDQSHTHKVAPAGATSIHT
jgi:hypothetical protein